MSFLLLYKTRADQLYVLGILTILCMLMKSGGWALLVYLGLTIFALLLSNVVWWTLVTVDLLTLGLTNALLLILPLRDWTDVLVMQNGAKLSHPLLFITCQCYTATMLQYWQSWILAVQGRGKDLNSRIGGSVKRTFKRWQVTHGIKLQVSLFINVLDIWLVLLRSGSKRRNL